MEQMLTTALLLGMVVVVVIGVVYFVVFDGADKIFRNTLFRRYEGLAIRTQPEAGDVAVTYHTYRGLLVWFVQDEHRFYANPSDALALLGRLMRFNLTYGMFSYGMVFVPFLAIGNYFAQRRSINKQAKQIRR